MGSFLVFLIVAVVVLVGVNIVTHGRVMARLKTIEQNASTDTSILHQKIAAVGNRLSKSK